jgi:hypothetical protein
MVVTPADPTPELPDVIGSSEDGDRSSVTDVNGTVAKFEMAYSPVASDRFAFGPPLAARVPGLLFLAFAVAVNVMVFMAYNGSSNSRLYVWIVEGDRHRVMGSVPLALIIMLTAVGNVLKTSLRGVVVTAGGIEARVIRPGGFPSVKRWTWAQIDRVVVADDDVMLELWDGTYERLPKVREGKRLSDLLAGIATARGRTVTRLSRAA